MQFYTDASSGKLTPVPPPPSRLLKTVYGFFPTTNVNISLVQMQFLKTVYGRFPTADAALLLSPLQAF